MEINEHNKEFQEQVIHIARVARVVKGGRRFRFRALVAVGDGKKRVGVGIAKGSDVQNAVTKAIEVAKKHLIELPITRETIPHEAIVRVGGSLVMLKPASQGRGIIAGGTVRTILELSGIRNIVSKTHGSTNKVNVAYATIQALSGLVPRQDWITSRQPASKPEAKAAPKPKAKVAKTVKTAPKPKKTAQPKPKAAKVKVKKA